jgi:hypothetical protein
MTGTIETMAMTLKAEIKDVRGRGVLAVSWQEDGLVKLVINVAGGEVLVRPEDLIRFFRHVEVEAAHPQRNE